MGKQIKTKILSTESILKSLSQSKMNPEIKQESCKERINEQQTKKSNQVEFLHTHWNKRV
jgi:hypothetical protein